MAFVDSLSTKDNSDVERIAELYDIITQEGLGLEETRKFVASAFRCGFISMPGDGVIKILSPVSCYVSDGDHIEKRQYILGRIGSFFERFFGLSAGREL